MSQLSYLASTYIEGSKASLLKKYYHRHSEGAVILYFNSDGSLYKDSFSTKSELQFATMLPRNAYSEAQEYWINNPEQLIFLSWFYPITPGARFNVYCLGTVIKTFNTSTYNQPPVYSEPSSYTSKQADEPNGNGCLLFFFGSIFILGVLAVIASLAAGDFGYALACLICLPCLVVGYGVVSQMD